MKTVYKPSEPYGFEQIFIEDTEQVPDGCIEIEPPVPNWKPVFNFEQNKWIETATDEEMKGTAVDDPTEIDLLKEENKELKKELEETKADVTNTQIGLAEVYGIIMGGDA
ncbi:hypothetical protein P7D58_02615 [Enterococcus avium]|uniref:hypothetical protein n=1 Tax=Enterococcus avium TaxID=33945 RepID=UPI00288CA9E1|nr:hypothetical protein [Enterococcus avium]MDT2392796.1 hypothetical protein [Enterococcus avium]MDT2416568.1 hypothetical protein [Enterococcus avium]MDT2429898.1 hypothetical protein [Enterococcus avium]MDT2438886.1 hypothetical protein [Enterococcus avium]MDT2452004.1 hypothetical protein [Enterococcus avium]